MGKYIRPLSDAVFTIASDDLWIESLAIQQLHTTANLPNMQRVVGMPDLHPGRGYPIGAAFFSVGRFYPALVGNDIGWRYGKQIFSLANTTPISLKSDYQIWMTLLKKAGWRKTCRQHLHSIRGATRLAPSVAVTTSQNCNRLIKLSTRNCLHWLVWMRSICNCWFIAARGDWGSLFYSGILPRFRIMVCLKAVTTRYGILRNMTMRWRLRVLIAS
ncbi:Putative release factor H-coupled RctB family protein [Escherichia coli]